MRLSPKFRLWFLGSTGAIVANSFYFSSQIILLIIDNPLYLIYYFLIASIMLSAVTSFQHQS